METVRFYQRKGLVEEPPRTGSRHRRYPPETVARIRFIRGAQNLGFSSRDIEELMEPRVAAGTSKAEIKARAEAKVAEIEEKLHDSNACGIHCSGWSVHVRAPAPWRLSDPGGVRKGIIETTPPMHSAGHARP